MAVLFGPALVIEVSSPFYVCRARDTFRAGRAAFRLSHDPIQLATV
jgi:hypothetical protein